MEGREEKEKRKGTKQPQVRSRVLWSVARERGEERLCSPLRKQRKKGKRETVLRRRNDGGAMATIFSLALSLSLSLPPLLRLGSYRLDARFDS